MRRVFIICAVAALLFVLVACEGWRPKEPDVTIPTPTVTMQTTPETTTPEVTTPKETTPEETTPTVTEPDFENDPEDGGTKRY